MPDRKPAGNMLWALLLFFVAAAGFNGCGDVNNVSPPPVPPTPGPLTITSTSLLIGVVGQPYADTLGGSGGTTPYTWSLAPALPAGLSLNPTTGAITGTPTATNSQLHTFTLKDSSSPQEQVQKPLTLTVVAPPPVLTILTTTLPPGTINQPYSEPLQTFGGSGALTWSLIGGALPQNFSLDPSTGVISGTLTGTTPSTSNFTVQVADTGGQVDSQALSITINLPPAPNITTTSPLPGGTVGIPYSQPVQATGGTGALTWSISAGILPPPLTIDPATGLISGTPGTSGTFNFTVRVTDSFPLSVTKSLSITIAAAPVPPSITTTSLLGGTVGTAYSRPLQRTGGTAPFTWSFTGTLPTGLSLNPSTGVISGTPSATGTFNFTPQITDSLSLTDTTPPALSITIVNPPAPTITTTSPLPGGTVGTAYSQTILATGGTGSRVWGVTSGSLPSNLSLSPTTGVISGTPTSAGTSSFTVQVTDSLSLSDTKSLSITIAAAPVPPNITTTSLLGGSVGTAYSQPLQRTGGTAPFTWSFTGTLPTGLSLNPSTGVISGTPSATGTFNFTPQITDSLSLTDTTPPALSIVISGSAPNITTLILPDGTVGTAYNQILSATGGAGTLVWSPISGSLPSNLSLSPAGVISGTPTGTGTANFTVQVTDGFSQTDTQALSITITAAPQPLTITSTTPLPAGPEGAAYNTVLTATGGTGPGTYTWTLAGDSVDTLPTGLTLAADGTLSGTPDPGTAKTYSLKFTVTDTTPQSVSAILSLTIN